MSTLLRLSCAGALCLSGIARGQFAPPGDGGSPDVGASAASPASTGGVLPGGTLDIGRPQVASRPDANPGNDGPLAVVHANQALTANALIGFIDAQPIFLNDLFRPIDADLRRLALNARSLIEFQRNAGALIANQIRDRKSDIELMAAAEAQLTDQDRTWLESRLIQERNQLIADHGGSVPAAERALAATGSSVEQEMSDLRRKFIKDMYLQRNLRPRIVITRQMLLDAYEHDRATKWHQPAQVELYTITLAVANWLCETTTDGKRGPVMTNPTSDQIAAAEKQALEQGRRILQQLRNGADFAALAEDNESADGARRAGGRVGLISKGAMRNTALEQQIFALDANSLAAEPLLLHEADFKISSVVIIKVGKKTDERTVPFNEVQAQIAADLRLAQWRDLFQQEIDRLDRGAAVEAVDRMADVALAAAVTRYVMK